jgi:hypothetical protein
MLVEQVLVHVREGLDQPARVVSRERAREDGGILPRSRAQALESADLAGDLAELRGVLPGPRRHRAISGAFVPRGLDPLLAREPCVLGGPEPEVASLGSLSCRHPEHRGERGP